MENEAKKLLKYLNNIGVTLWQEDGALRYRAPKGVLSSSNLEKLKFYKNNIINILANQEREGKTEIDSESQFIPFPLSDVQSAYLLGREELFEYGSVACHIYMELNYSDLEHEMAEEAWNKLILRHNMLRAVFDKKGNQRILETVPRFKINYMDLSEGDVSYNKLKLNSIREEMGHRIYNAENWPLFDVGITKMKNNSILHFSMDFLIADWTSILLLISEFEKIYENPNISLPELKITFKDYMVKEHNLKKSPEYLSDKKYWMDRIDSLPLAPKLPLNNKKAEDKKAVNFKRYSLHLDNEKWTKIKNHTKNFGLTPSTIVMTAYAKVIEKWSSNKKFLLNLTLLNRQPLHPQVNEIIGDFTSVNLLEINMENDYSFKECAKSIQNQLLDDLDHRLFSGVEVLRETSRRKGRENALMPIVFTSAIGLTKQIKKSKMKGQIGEHGISQTPQVFIDCQAMDNEMGLDINWDVREGVFPKHMIEDMFKTFKKLLNILSENEKLWDEKEILKLPSWQEEVLKKVNDTKLNMDTKLLHYDIFKNAIKYPEKIAVIDSKEQLSYSELVFRSLNIGSKLKELGCRPQDKVAIIMDKSVHQVSSVLGVLAIGGVYVPIDVKQPYKRLQNIIKKANIKYIITNSSVKRTWDESLNVIEVDKLIYSNDYNVTPQLGNPELPAYVIFTSGSTGEPKGVIISHKAAMNTIDDINTKFDVKYTDKVIGLAKLSFDLSVYDIFGLLSVGGTLIYPNNDRLTDPSHWAELMIKHGVTIWNTVPAMMEILISYLSYNSNINISTLRLTLLSGDWIPLKLPNMINNYLPNSMVVSLGGATEAAIWSIYHIYEGYNDEYKSIPYGKPLSNQQFRILDYKMNDCPVWCQGELYILGDGLAYGYLNDEGSTSKQFVTHPSDKMRMYKTGDLGCYHPDGNIEFLGRIDNQVKIKGHRIELGEIESALIKHPSIAMANVLVDKINEEKSLLGVVKLANSRNIDKKEISSNLYKLYDGIHESSDSVIEDIDSDSIKNAVNCLDKVVLNSMLYSLQKIGLLKNGEKINIEDITNCEKISDDFHWIVIRWLSKLKEDKVLLTDDNSNYVCSKYITKDEIEKQWDILEQVWEKISGTKGFINYLRGCFEKLPQLLAKEQDPVSLLYPEGKMDYVQSLYFEHIISRYLNSCIATLIKRIAENHPKKPLRILEIGAGTGATTEQVLDILKEEEIEYLFTDNTKFFIPSAKSRFEKYKGVTFGIFDIDNNYRTQGFAPNSFDIIIGAEVIENAKNIPKTFKNLIELLSPQGWMVFSEPVKEQNWILISQAFMMTKPSDELRVKSSYLNADSWLSLMKQHSKSPILMLPQREHRLAPFGINVFAMCVKEEKELLKEKEIIDYLSQQVPDYMIPSHIQIVDEIALTVNGKVDKKELSTWRPKIIENKDIITVKNEEKDFLENYLTDLWTEALSIPCIDKTEDFYHCGADSLIMAQVAAKLRSKLSKEPFKKDIPFDVLLKQMLNEPNIKSSAKFIRNYDNDYKKVSLKQENNSNGVITKFNSEKKEPLRVVFHAGLGSINEFGLLLENLKEQGLGTVVGITVNDDKIYRQINEKNLINALADDYSKLLIDTGYEKFQLIGHSMGGLIAVEVARRLLENNISVIDVALIDSFPGTFYIEDDLILEAMFQLALNINLNQVGCNNVGINSLSKGINYLLKENKEKISKGSACLIGGNETLNKVGNMFRKMDSLSKKERFKIYSSSIENKIPVEMLEELFSVFCHSSKSANYIPEAYVGDIRFFKAKEFSNILVGDNESVIDLWKDICIGDLEVIEIEGNHFSCVNNESYVKKLVKLIASPIITN